jgi:hypothetical protein
MKSGKHLYGILGCLGILFQVITSEAQESNVGPRIPTKNGQSAEPLPTVVRVVKLTGFVKRHG